MLIFCDSDFGEKNNRFDNAFLGQVSEVHDGLFAVVNALKFEPYSDDMEDTCATELS